MHAKKKVPRMYFNLHTNAHMSKKELHPNTKPMDLPIELTAKKYQYGRHFCKFPFAQQDPKTWFPEVVEY
jgi:hypothetical protein